MRAGRLGACDRGFPVDHALVRELRGIAHEGPVAEVAVFKRRAVVVSQAVAGHLERHALLVLALVGDGARVAVVASECVGGEDASPLVVARIVGAGVFIITVHLGAGANACGADICNGARVAVDAFDLVEGVMLAARFCDARVLRARVAVVAQVDMLSFHLQRLVGLPVAVLVDPVALLLLGHGRITFSKPVSGADALPLALAPLVGYLAGCPEAQLDGLGGARADAGVRDALHAFYSVDAGHLLAGEPPRAFERGFALAAAEGALIAVVDASVLGPAFALAVVAVRARAAEVGVS